MRNIIDYVLDELAPFSEKPFSPVDSLVLSQLSYVDLKDLVPEKCSRRKAVKLSDLLKAEHFQDMFEHVLEPESNRKLLFALAASPRFRDLGVVGYTNAWDDKTEKQFAAVTFLLDKKSAYIAFRGTDNSLVGWKEDFNMAFQSPVPSQQDALGYLQTVARKCSGQLMVGGHSKGGNLAIYSAALCGRAIQDRISRVYSHDGPGFKKNAVDASKLDRIADRIDKTLPQSSIIGMLLENQERYTIVKSSRIGLLQHDPFSWIVEDDHFIQLDQLSAQAQLTDRTLHDWLASISDGQREKFVDTLFSIFEAAQHKDLIELGSDWQNALPAMIESARAIDSTTRKFLMQTLKGLTKSALRNLYPKNSKKTNGE